MAVNIPVGFGQAAFIFSSSIGTPNFVTTIGVDLGDVGGNYVGAADHLHEAYDVAFMGTTNDAITLTEVQLAIGLEEGGSGSVLSTRDAVVGGDPDPIPPVNLAVILRKNTNYLGRRGRGRMFLPGAVNTSQIGEGGNIGEEATTGLSTAGNDFLNMIQLPDVPGTSDPTVTPMVPVLLHSSALLPTPIISMAVAPLIGVVRKRVR